MTRRVLFAAATIAVLAPATALAGPDLTCTVEAEVIGQTVKITVTVENVGDEIAVNELYDLGIKAVAAGFWDPDGVPTGATLADLFVEFDELAPKGKLVVSATSGQLSVGSHTAYCLVNGSGQVSGEDSTENNLNSAQYEIGLPPPPEPDLIALALTGSPDDAPQPPCPDGQICYKFDVTVKNIGADVAPGFSVDIFAGLGEDPDFASLEQSSVFCEVPDGLDPEQEDTVSCLGKAAFEEAGPNNVWAYVDFLEQVEEADEENNAKEFTIVVVGPPDVLVFDLTAAQAAEGEPVEFTVVVENAGGSAAKDVGVCVFWQKQAEPGPDDLPSAQKSLESILSGQKQQVVFTQVGPVGGTWQAYVVLDCKDELAESDEDNNSAAVQYDVVGAPNEPPVIESVDGVSECHEAAPCTWTINAVDLTAAELTYTVVDGPLGMWADPVGGVVHYTPPLGSTAKTVTATVEVHDALFEAATEEIIFTILPPDGFDGIVGAIGSMPIAPQKAPCALIEVPGLGLAYVNQSASRIDLHHAPTSESSAGTSIFWKQVYPVDGELSCHLEPFQGGGFAALEVTTQMVLIFGTNGTLLRKADLAELVEPGVYSDHFLHVGGGTLAFLDAQDPPNNKLVFINAHTGALDEAWGGNDGATPGEGVAGVLELHDVQAMYADARYLWSDGSVIRLFNVFNNALHLVDYALDGTIVATTPLGDIVPEAPPGQDAQWDLLAAVDGGLQLVDYTTATLQWYDESLNPVSQFTLPDPAADAGTWPAGWVSLGEYGLSVNNVHCEALGAGGFTCHDIASQRGFVIDEFADLWENCPKLDVSPPTVNFGGVDQNSKKPVSVTVANKGGGVLQITSAGITNLTGGSSGQFSKEGIPQGSTVLLFPGQLATVKVTYQPTNFGAHKAKLTFTSNACEPVAVDMVGYSGSHLEVEPIPVEFLGVGPGEHSRTVTLRSVGSQAVTVSKALLENPAFPVFTMKPAQLSQLTLEPGEEFFLELRFDADDPGTHEGTLIVTSNSYDIDAANQQVPIIAKTAPLLRAEPPGFNSGAINPGDTVTRTIQLRNTGYTQLVLGTPKLTGPPGFSMKVPETLAPLGHNEALSIELAYTANAKGTAVALITLPHDDANRPPYVLTAVAGTGTELAAGFGGVLPLSSDAGFPFAGPLGVHGGHVELSTGGFAFYGSETGAIHVVTGIGAPDTWFGIEGRIQITGTNGAFPDATDIGGTLIELVSGGFALLSDTEGSPALYCVGPDGQPNRFIGSEGVIELEAVFPALEDVGDTLVQLPTGTFVTVDRAAHHLLYFRPDGSADSSFGSSGVLSFVSGNPVAGDGFATGVGDSLAVTSQGGIVFGDTATSRFYTLSSDAKQATTGAEDVPLSFVGALAPFEAGSYVFYDPASGVVSRHDAPLLELDASFGTAGKVDFSAIWPDATFGTSVIGLRSGAGVALADTSAECECLRFVNTAGEALELVPKAQLDLPESLDFGKVAVGEISAPQFIQVSNDGDLALEVTTLFSSPQFHLADGAVKTSVPPGGTVQLAVVFEPTFVDTHTAKIDVTTNDPSWTEPGVVQLIGSTGPHLTTAPTDPLVDFGAVLVGLPAGQTPVKSIFLSNTGADPLLIETVGLTNVGEGGGAFSFTNKPGDNTIVNPKDQPKAVQVTCNPPSAGVFYGYLTVAHDVDGQAPVIFTLVCRSGPQIQVTPAEVSCSDVTLGNTTTCGSVLVSNVGNAPLTIVDTQAAPAGFAVEPHSLTLAPGEDPLVITVTYQALTTGAQTGALTILHDDPGAGGKTEVPLTGTTKGAIVLKPSVLSFGAVPNGSEVQLPIVVFNSGGAGDVQYLAATASTTSVGSGPVFGVNKAPPTPSELGEGEGLEILVRCRPEASGKHSGTLLVATDAAGYGALEADLSCISGAYLVADPEALHFGPVPGNLSKALPVVFTNVGLATASISAATIDPPDSGFTLAALTSEVVAPGESTVATVLFEPSITDSYSATLHLASAAGGALASVELTGLSGPKLALVSTGDPLDFGVQGIGTHTTRTVQAVNIGSAPFTITAADLGAPSAPFALDPAFDDDVTLEPGQLHSLAVRFSPVTVGTFDTTLTVQGGAGGTETLDILGRAGGLLSVLPTDLDFGDTPEGQTATLDLVIANLGPAQPLDVAFFQSGDSAFQVVGALKPSGTVLGPGEVLEGVTVEFTPQSAGNFEGKLTVFSAQGVEGGSIDVTLAGKSGASAKLIYPPTAFHGFHAVPVGSTSTRQTVVAATGKAPVALLGATVVSDSSVFDASGLFDAPLIIEAGKTTTVEARCSPSAAGVYNGELHLLTDAPDNPDIVIQLWCSTPQIAEVAPAELEFGGVATLNPATGDVTLTNTGKTVLVVASATIEAGQTGGFALISPPPEDQGLEPDGQITLTVQFLPTEAGSFTGVLRVTTDDPVHPQIEIPLSGFSGARLEASPRVVNYCTTTGDRFITLTNQGTSPLNVTQVGFAGVTDPELSYAWVEGVEEDVFLLDPGSSRTLELSFNGIITSDAKVSGAELVVQSSDQSHPSTTVRIIVGEGIAIDDGFTGIADVGAPGAEPAFEDAIDLGAGLAELCTGGFALSGVTEKRLYFAAPAVGGSATVLDFWGSEFGFAELDPVLDGADLAGGGAADFGAILTTLDGGLLAVGSISAGTYVLLAGDGGIATDHPSGGIIRLSELLGETAVAGGIAMRGEKLVAVDVLSGRLVGLTEAGALDETFGTGGLIDLVGLFDASPTVGRGVASMSGNNPSVAVTDGARILVVKPNGSPDTAFGDGGVITLASAFDVAPVAVGAGIVRLGSGWGVHDEALGQLLFVLPDGTPNISVGKGGAIQVTGATGVFAGKGPLGQGLAKTTVVASPQNKDKLVLIDHANGDLLFVDADGTAFTKGVSELVMSCPLEIGNVDPDGTGELTGVKLINAGDEFLNLAAAGESPAIGVSTEAVSCSGEGFACADGTLLNGGESTAIALSWTPGGTPGCYSETLTVHHDGVNGPTLVCPLALQTRARFEVTPGAPTFEYAFPPQAIGTSFEKEFIVRNTGCANLTLNEIGVSGDAAFFLEGGIAPGEDKVLPPGEIHKLFVRCAPDAAGAHEGSLQFAASPSDAIAIAQVQLSCVTGPLVVAEPGELTWLNVPVGGSQTREVTLTSQGGAPAKLNVESTTELSLSGADAAEAAAHYSIVPQDLSADMPIGSSQTLKITFAPKAHVADLDVKLIIGSNSYVPIEIPLFGGVAPVIVFDPDPVVITGVPVGAETPTSVDFTMENAGVATLIIEPVPSSLEETVFGVEPVQVFNLSPANPAEASITCLAQEAGVYEAVLTFEAPDAASADANGYVYLPLVCRVGDCVDVAPLELTWGSVAWTDEVANQVVTITNPHTNDATVEAEILAGAGLYFSLADAETTITVPGEDSVDLAIRFQAPESAGIVTSTLVLTVANAVGDEDCPTAISVGLKAGVTAPGDEGGDDDTGQHVEAAEAVDDDTGGSVDTDAHAEGGGTTGTAEAETVPPPAPSPDCECDVTAGPPRSAPVGPASLLLLLLAGLGFQRARRRTLRARARRGSARTPRL